jgi:hypothetical protein
MIRSSAVAALKAFLTAVVLARAEIQGAIIATFNVLALAGIIHPSEDMLAGVNALLGAWFSVAQAMLFRRDVKQLGKVLAEAQ